MDTNWITQQIKNLNCKVNALSDCCDSNASSDSVGGPVYTAGVGIAISIDNVISATGSVTGALTNADNGLNVLANVAKLGGPLTANTTIDGGANFLLTYNSSRGGTGFTVASTAGLGMSISGTTGGIQATTAAATQLQAAVAATNSSSGTGVRGVSTSGFGGLFETTTGAYGMQVQNTPASTNTVVGVAKLLRDSSTTAADGIGGSLDFHIKNNGGAVGTYLANQIISKWATSAVLSRVSELSITGVNSGTTLVLLRIDGTGRITLPQGLPVFADDTAAGTGGMLANQLYKTSAGVVMMKS